MLHRTTLLVQQGGQVQEGRAVITEVDDYFDKGCGRCERFATPTCSVHLWMDGLNMLRGMCRDMGLAETVRWGHPCYRLHDRNIALLGAFRSDFTISFMNAELLKDAQSVLMRAGPNSAPSMLRFRDSASVSAKEPVIRACLAELMACAAAGVRPARSVRETEMPDELIEALAADPEMAEAFDRLTPGRQRSYALLLASAKTAQTRMARIAKSRERIIAGKGANER